MLVCSMREEMARAMVAFSPPAGVLVTVMGYSVGAAGVAAAPPIRSLRLMTFSVVDLGSILMSSPSLMALTEENMPRTDSMATEKKLTFIVVCVICLIFKL